MKIEFETSEDAFVEYGAEEVRRILESIADKVEYGYTSGVIMDINGNKIGWWKV